MGGRTVLALVVALAATPALAGDYDLPPELTPLVSAEGRALLASAADQESFLALTAEFETQDTQTFCGVASSVMVLNALGVPAPVDPRYEPYRYFTQETFFSPASETILPRGTVTEIGYTLDQLADVLRIHGASVRVVHAEDISPEAFREDMAAALSADDTYVIANYLGTAIGQTENYGHFSPVAAFAEAEDRLLVLDVARYVYPQFWVETGAFHAAMNTPDSDNANRSRGYLVVTRP
jgi:hypothetical protein